MHHLQRDLEEWETLYMAGRLHKPVRILRQDAKLALATKKNLQNAVRASLLMLPERFTEEDLYLTIAGLSFSGDFRMLVGENPHKVYNIVYAQIGAFREKYQPILDDLPNINMLVDGTYEVGNAFQFESPNSLQQDLSTKLRGSMIMTMPQSFRDRLKEHYLWSLSKKGQTKIAESDREEPIFSQSMGQFSEIGVCARKSKTF
jgi:translocator assembly and maintenance protein 41